MQSSDNIPAGYEPISLLEALNGLRSASPSLPSAPLYDEISYSGVVDGMAPASRPLGAMDRALEGAHQKGKRSKSPDRSAGHGGRSSCKPQGLVATELGARRGLWLVLSLLAQLAQNFRRTAGTCAREGMGILSLCSV